MTFEEFERHITRLKEAFETEDKLSKILHCEGFLNFTSGVSDSIIDLLEDYFCDDEDWIYYWLYELDFGQKWKPGLVQINGSEIKLQTIEDLYGILNK